MRRGREGEPMVMGRMEPRPACKRRLRMASGRRRPARTNQRISKALRFIIEKNVKERAKVERGEENRERKK